jgi:hypothetical protein
MKADIGRVTFDPTKRFLRVVMQQGRAQLESDWNEQVAILLHAVRSLAADLIGPWGGSPGAFEIGAASDVKNNFSIAQGRYYVDGILCENRPKDGKTFSYANQPYYPVSGDQQLKGPQGGGTNHYLAYLDVWERLVTAAEDQDIREVALGGADTAARTEAVWQVRIGQFAEDDISGVTCDDMLEKWPDLLKQLQNENRGRLRARARMPEAEIDRPCAIDPSAAYRFDENALFRVEVHTPGPAGTATFKWSLDNGAVAFPIETFDGSSVRVTTLGRDARLSLEAGDWVELEYDAYVLQNGDEALYRVQSVDHTDLMVTLDRQIDAVDPEQHPRLRRWDQKGTTREPLEPNGTVKIVEAAAPDTGWINLSYGVQVQFVPLPPGSPPNAPNYYRTGDYWLIPARSSIGDVLWPQVRDNVTGKLGPEARPPQGVEHHYAPLAWVAVAADGTVAVRQEFRRTIKMLAECPETDV